MLIYCLIPARKGSKRIKNKNLLLLQKQHLINITVASAINTKLINKTFVSTNDKKIKSVLNSDANIIERPNSISKDSSTTEECISHFIKTIRARKIKIPNIIVLLQCTSPYRKKNDIHLAIQKFMEDKLDSLFSGCSNKNLFWVRKKKKLVPINYMPLKRLREQKMKEQFIENGSIYVFKTKGFLKHKCRLYGKIGIHIMSKENSFQIDSKEDIKIINKINDKS